jgi:hypothetical protein
MKVLKFGGASLKDKAAYTETIRVLKAKKNRRFWFFRRLWRYRQFGNGGRLAI